MNPQTTLLPVKLPNGATIQVRAAAVRGEQDIAARMLGFDSVMAAIEGIAGAMATALERAKPQKASVEFELDFSVEAGQLTALFVQASGGGTLRISLEWREQ